MSNKYISKNMRNRFSKSTTKLSLVLFLFLGIAITANLNATNHTVQTVGMTFSPATLTINVGDSVTFINTAGSHNVNGTISTFPLNPIGFSNPTGISAGWTYVHVFSIAGTYNYQCDPHIPAMVGTIQVLPSVVVSASPASSTGAPNGQINVSVIGGTGPYDYTWFNISTTANGSLAGSSNPSFSANVFSGSYVVLTIDNGSGIPPFFSQDTVIVTAPGGSFSYNGLTGVCGSNTINITASLNGCSSGTQSIGTQYILSDNSGTTLLNTTLLADSVLLPSIGVGTYYLSALNFDNGCTAIDTFNIGLGSLATNTSTTNVINATFGSAIITASGGVAPYTLCWQDSLTPPPCQLISSWNNGGTLNGLTTGTYLYTVSDAFGCNGTGSITIENVCSAAISNSFSICDSSVLLDAEVIMVGNGPYTFEYELSDVNNIIETQIISTDSIRFTTSITSSGMYYLSVLESISGCISTDSIEVLINPITVTSSVTDCTNPINCNGSITVTPISGLFPYIYTWNGSNPVIGPSTTQNSLCEDTFCLSISDANGCIYDDCYDVICYSCDVNITIFDSIPCFDGLGIIQATIDTFGLPAGPQIFTGPRYTYQLFTTNPLTLLTTVSTDSSFANFPNLPSNNYLVSIFDSSYNHICISDSIFLSQPDDIIIYTSVDSSSATWANDGIITIDSITGGTAPYSVQWLDSTLTVFANGGLIQDTLMYSNLFTGGYTIDILDTNNCFQRSEPIYVHPRNARDSLQFNNAFWINPTCFDSCDGSIFAPVDSVGAYAAGPFTFKWYDKLTSPPTLLKTDSCVYDAISMSFICSPFYSPNIATFNNRCNGVYGLVAYDYYGNQFPDIEFVVEEPDSMYVQTADDFVIDCGEDSILNSLVSGGTSITNDTVFINTQTLNFSNAPTGFSETLNPLPIGHEYWLQVSGTYDSSGFTFDAGYQFDPVLNTAISTTVPMNWVMNGNSLPTPNNYEPNHVYNFQIPAGTHTFEILNTSFSGNLTFTLREIIIDTPIYTYSWETITPFSVISTYDTALAYPGIDSTDYVVTVTDANGCIAKDTVNVSWDLYILNFASIQVTDVICNGDPTGTISVTADDSTGFSPFSYSIPDLVPDSIPSSIFVLDTTITTGLFIGNYIFHLKDSIGCLSFDTIVTISEPDSVYACGIDTSMIEVEIDNFIMTFDSQFTHNPIATQSGIMYKLVVSGTYYDSWNNLPAVDVKDAAYQFRDTVSGNLLTPPLAVINDWWWNGDSLARPTPDNYDATNHRYEYNFIGDGNDQIFTYTDPTGQYNNSGAGGSLEFKLYKIVCSKTDTAFTCYGDSTAVDTIHPRGGVPYRDNQGNPYYDVKWTDNSGVVWPGDSAVSGLPAGDYTATITDSTGCIYERYLIVLQPTDTMQIDSISHINILCKGDSSGSIYAIVSGGFGPKYVVLKSGNDTVYSNGGLSSLSDTIIITDLAAGTYDFYLYDTIPDGLYGIYGCERSLQIVITAPQDFLSSAFSSSIDVSCWGDSTGQATANVTGGLAPYLYEWDNGETGNVATGLWADINSVWPSPLWQGIKFTDDNGCTLRDSIQIKHLYPQIEAFNTLDSSSTVQIIQNASCFNDCDAIATLSTIGGAPNTHTYTWDIGQTSIFNPEADTAFVLCAGGHDVLVEDALGCRQTIRFMITEPDELFAQAIMTQPVQCFGFNNGTAFGTATGGTTLYTFVWDSINGQTGQSAVSLTPGTHTLYVTDIKGCMASDTVVITEPDELQVEIIDSMTIYSYCTGTNSGQLCAIATGGTIDYTYTWSLISGQLIPENQSCVDSLMAGQYIVSVVDGRGCGDTTSFNLDSIAVSLVADSVTMTITDASCFGYFNGAVTVNSVLGGASPYSYNWTPAVGTGNTISSLYAGSYALVIEDNNGCQLTVNAEVGEPEELQYTTYNVIEETCFGECDGQIWVNVEGGSGNYYYDESESGTFPIATANQLLLVNDSLIFDLCLGLHSIYITDDNNCQSAVVFGGRWEEFVDSGVVVTSPIVVTSPASCSNINDGSAWIPFPYGDPLFTYTWETSPITSTIDVGDSTSILFPGGDYVLIAHYSDSASFGQVYSACDASSAPFVIGSPPPIISGANVTDVTCWGDIDGRIQLSPSGGVSGQYLFSWDTTTSVNITLSDQNQYPLQPGTYTVTITDVDGCQMTEDITVGEPDPITATFNISPASCYGLSDGSATALPVGGVSSYSYQWYNAQVIFGDTLITIIGGSTNATASGLDSNLYCVVISDGNSCSDTAFVTITHPLSVTTRVEADDLYLGDDNVRCFGESNASATAEGAAISFSWKNSANIEVSTSQTTGAVLAADTYTLTASDANGCTAVTTLVITEPAEFLVNGVTSGQTSSFGFDISCYGLSDGSIAVYPSGGFPGADGYIYSWTGISNEQNILFPNIKLNLITGSYQLSIEDANGCQVDTSWILTQPADTFVANVTTVNYAGPTHGPASILFVDSTTTSTNDIINHVWFWDNFNEPETFLASNGINFAHEFTEIGVNDVYVLVQNANTGCIDRVDFSIIIQGIKSNNVFTPNGDGSNDRFYFGEAGMKEFSVQIFNRWGQEVYSWSGSDECYDVYSDKYYPSCWDGKGVSGDNMPEGVYFYVLKAIGEDGRNYEEKGSVSLLR